MVSQYPHQLYFDAGYYPEAQKDANGRIIQPTRVNNPQILDCRAETNDAGSGAKIVTTTDGERIDFAFTVFLPSGTVDITTGTKVEIKQGNYLVVSGQVKRYERGFFHNRFWI
ncbi:hypothetical protein AHMF7605_11810 [Adhaeribacter arboris]|uniref:Uncharacterized protein n=1 Tax=Adhaeribacter arboris TaxID=2072846 RepID=A0A2T2YF75_9BACT|nr:hypothetical protein [Adhaeribacter arboris]PSR54157.1 hypothetical protein AHMF7605_11810 [Adhaeribacter arboris]